ncbi:MAG: nucleotidyltransferase domain-containing protein [Chloroflexi bacterium]|nr:nucleotidyltransferase domain-containing protein [Chloroflexota bacterium]
MGEEPLPVEKQALLDALVESLSAVQGVRAVVLGGSYARGTQRPDSDLDIGLYYREDQPFSVEDVRRVAGSISANAAPVVTDFYGWGPWVNGGAWIQTAAGKVDFLYRNIEQVERTIREARQGISHHDFDQQPAFGFYSVIYLAETRICLPLYDPDGTIARLKTQVAVYPPLLKKKIVSDSLWLAEFTLAHANQYAKRGDVYCAVGAFTRILSYLPQALFALNETYFLNDKTAMAEIAAFSIRPKDFVARLSGLLAHPGQTPEELVDSTRAIYLFPGDCFASLAMTRIFCRCPRSATSF